MAGFVVVVRDMTGVAGEKKRQRDGHNCNLRVYGRQEFNLQRVSSEKVDKEWLKIVTRRKVTRRHEIPIRYFHKLLRDRFSFE